MRLVFLPLAPAGCRRSRSLVVAASAAAVAMIFALALRAIGLDFATTLIGFLPGMALVASYLAFDVVIGSGRLLSRECRAIARLGRATKNYLVIVLAALPAALRARPASAARLAAALPPQQVRNRIGITLAPRLLPAPAVGA